MAASGPRLIVGVLAMSLACAAATAAAESRRHNPCDIPAAIKRAPPRVAGKPVEVSVDLVIVDLIDVNDTEQTFSADAVLALSWFDPRLSAEARGESLEVCRFDSEDIWHPDVRPLNRRTLRWVLGPTISVAADGKVRYETHALGEFSSRLRLKEFPFDTQRLRIRLSSFRHGPDEVRFIAGRSSEVAPQEFSLAGWRLLGSYMDATVPPVRVDVEEFSRVDHVLVVQRRPGYYLWNFMLPLVFIVLMAWTVFWLDPKSAGTQIAIATASAFTLVAFLISLRARMPPVPYLTQLDELVVVSTLLVFAAFGQAVFTSRLADANRLALARRIDAYGRWIYLAAFLVVLYATLLR